MELGLFKNLVEYLGLNSQYNSDMGRREFLKGAGLAAGSAAATALLPKRAGAQDKKRFPLMVNGGDDNVRYRTRVTLVNSGYTDESLNVYFLNQSSSPQPLAINGAIKSSIDNIVIPAGGTKVIETDGLGDISLGPMYFESNLAKSNIVANAT